MSENLCMEECVGRTFGPYLLFSPVLCPRLWGLASSSLESCWPWVINCRKRNCIRRDNCIPTSETFLIKCIYTSLYYISFFPELTLMKMCFLMLSSACGDSYPWKNPGSHQERSSKGWSCPDDSLGWGNISSFVFCIILSFVYNCQWVKQKFFVFMNFLKKHDFCQFKLICL